MDFVERTKNMYERGHKIYKMSPGYEKQKAQKELANDYLALAEELQMAGEEKMAQANMARVIYHQISADASTIYWQDFV